MDDLGGPPLFCVIITYVYIYMKHHYTKTPENKWLEDKIFFEEGLFSGAMFVLGRVSSIK